ncbi:MAG: hypothetical protein ACK5Z2_19305 [Bacteroidota bacterium]
MSGIKTLTALVKALKPNEVTLCHNYLAAFDERGENYESKSRKLLILLCSEEQHTERELQFLLYGKMNVPAFSRLVLRLKEKLLEAVTLHINTKRHISQTAYTKAFSACRVRLHHAEFLLERGLTVFAGFYLSTVYDTALQFEFYPELLQILAYLQQINPAQGAKYEKLEGKYLQSMQLLHTCRELYRFAEAAPAGATEIQLNELRELEKQFHSVRVSFCLFETEALSAEKNNQFAKVVRCRKNQLRLIKQSPALQSGTPERETLLKLALLYLHCNKPEKALITAQQAKAVETGQDFDLSELLQIEAAAYIQLKRFTLAAKLLKETKPLSEKTVYLKALLLLCKNEFAEAAEVLELLNMKIADAEGFGVSARLLLLIAYTEQGQTKTQSKTAGMFRRVLATLPKYGQLTAREHCCIELVEALAETELNFKKVFQHKSEVINQLREYQPGLVPALHGANTRHLFRWEILPFQEWFISKALGVAFEMKESRHKPG